VVTLEVTDFALHWVTWPDPVRFPLFAGTPESAALKEQVGREGRVTTLIEPVSHMAVTPFIPNTLSAYGIATISGYDSIMPDGMILPKESPEDAEKLGRLAVSHLVTWTGNPDVPKEWQEVWQSPMMTLYRNPLALPRYAGFMDDDDKNAFFEHRAIKAARLKETTGKENYRSIQVTAGIRWIRIAENQTPGWQFRHAGDETAPWHAVERAPDASMLIENHQPGSATRIEMRYNPPLRKAGMATSFVSLLLLFPCQWLALRSRVSNCTL
jgi:hypothetical protein